MKKVFIVELLSLVNYNELFLENILVFKSLDLAYNFALEEKYFGFEYMIFERTLENDLTIEQLKEIEHNASLEDLDYSFGNFGSDKKLIESYKNEKETINNNFEVLLITDSNGIIFQLLVEKERLEELEKTISEAVKDFYNMREEDFKELEENGIDTIYEYLDYILLEEEGINVNTLNID